MLAMLCGCGGGDKGPERGEVEGVVTLDGQPLAGAVVMFAPQASPGKESGSTSVGVTDSAGKYTLSYSGDKTGAVIGTHLVRITTGRIADEDEGTPAVPEKVPVQYNSGAAANPDMKREVKAGRNELNFELKSEGEIRQPSSDE